MVEDMDPEEVSEAVSRVRRLREYDFSLRLPKEAASLELELDWIIMEILSWSKKLWI